MSPLALVHTVLGVSALVTGAVVLARRKGDALHRTVGWAYAAAMLALCGLSFGLRATTPFFYGLGPFHVAAIVSLVSVAGGVWTAWRRPPNWLEGHFSWMAWSYVGLVMATGSHVMRPLVLFFLHDLGLPGAVGLGLAVGVMWGLPPLVGSRWIARRAGHWKTLRPA